MKILIDLQSLQTGSARRGIGRYSSALALAMIDQLQDCELYVLLNDGEQDEHARSLINPIQEKIGAGRVIRFPLAELVNPALHLLNDEVRLSKMLRERFIEALAPDVVLVSSLFEFDAVSTIPDRADRSYLCAAILYDLIPLSDPAHYLANAVLQDWYADRLVQLRRADALLSISGYVRQDAMARLDLPDALIRNISAGTNLVPGPGRGNGVPAGAVKEKLVPKSYILYVGGFDKRKNVDRLVACYAGLPVQMRTAHKLVLAGGISAAQRIELQTCIRRQGLDHEQVVLYGFVEDEALVELYRNAHLFVFPSLDEGFGLPPLEAMAFGIPTITSNRASLPEVVGNRDALFDPDDPSGFLEKLVLGLSDEAYRAQLTARGLEQSRLFSWEASARAAVEFIRARSAAVLRGKARHYLSFRDFLETACAEQAIQIKSENSMKITNLLARALLSATDRDNAEKAMTRAAELEFPDSFSAAVPDYSKMLAPQVFSSMLCREQHFHLPLYTFWCRALGEKPRFHRKQWEHVYICQTLHERGYLRSGISAVGFGVGREPLVSYFASRGLGVLATDLDFSRAESLGWVATDQHSSDLDVLNERGLCDADSFKRLASFRTVDMNNIPQDIGKFDVCWSSCAFEHLGSIRKGLNFVLDSARLLKPGGIAVHTTEYNVGSNSRTLDNNPGFVIFRRCDIELLVKELAAEGYEVEPIDFSAGEDQLERYVDLPPYLDEPHLRLQLAGEYVSTSLGIIVRAPAESGQ